MGCPGCGGHGTKELDPFPKGTDGHILGCGSIQFPDQDRSNPFDKKEQEQILEKALTDVFSKNGGTLTARDVKSYVPYLATRLLEHLRAREIKPYPHGHTSP